MPADELRTPRLSLTPFTRDDFDRFFEACVLDPEVIRFWWRYGRTDLTLGQKRQMAIVDFLEPAEEGFRDAGLIVWSARVLDPALGPPGDFVGLVGVVPAEMPDQGPEPDLGYILAARYQGICLATEAGRVVVADAFARYGLERMAAIVDEPNTGSRRVLEKLGFRQVLRWVGEDGMPMLRFVIERAEVDQLAL